MTDLDKTEWPREIWMAERDEYDQGVVTAVLSEYATVARWEGDKERDRDFHRYVDADILESQERYYRPQIEYARAKAWDEAAAVCTEWFGTPDADDIARILHACILDLKDYEGGQNDQSTNQSRPRHRP